MAYKDVKKEISELYNEMRLKKMKEKESDVDKQRRLARLIAELEQDTGKVSDKDLERAKDFLKGVFPTVKEGSKNLEKDMKKGGKAKKMMGGGKVYASQNKKYGGGIYPKRGK